MYSTYDVRKWTDGAAGREKACRFGLPHSESLNPSHATELGKKNGYRRLILVLVVLAIQVASAGRCGLG